MALPSQQDLINAAANAEILEKVVSDPADQPNPGHPDGTVTTRLDKTYYNVQAALKGITDFSAALKWEFDDATTMSDPSAGNIRLDNATISSVTSIAISETDAEGEDVGDYVNSWADSTDANKGTLVLRSYSGAFAVFKITAITDDTGWVQVDVTYLSGSGSFTIGEAVFSGFSRTGDTGGLTEGGTNTFTGSNTFKGSVALNGSQSETLTATTNNLSLDATSNRLDVDLTGDQTLNGLTGGVDGRIVVVRSVDATETLTLTHDAAGSTAANRFSLPANQNFAVLPGQSVTLKYASSRWRLIAQTFSTGTDAGDLVQVGAGGELPALGAGLLTGIFANDSIFQKADITTPAFKKTAAQTISIKAGTRISAGGTVHYWSTDTAVTMPTHSAGSDYSIWLKTDGTLEAVADSFGSPATTGDLTSPQAGAVKVGGYHYGLVGPTETVAGGSFSTSGVTSAGGSFGWTQTDVDKIKGINEFSIWDDTFKCAGEQRGMAFDPIMKMWAAIYFMSDDPDTNGPSAYNTNVGSGTVLPYIPSAWGGDGLTKYSRLATFEANELVSAFGLRLPRYEEFMSIAFGVTEGQSLGGAASTITATARQAGYTSRIGIEQATGHQYAIGGPIHSVGGSNWGGVGRGSIHAGAGKIILGGARDNGSNSGSRSAGFHIALSNSSWFTSVRAAGDHLNLSQKVR
jgi:hypothetical protein